MITSKNNIDPPPELRIDQLRQQDFLRLCFHSVHQSHPPHRVGSLEVPENIVLFYIPPYTPEMNPIEQIWKEIRKRGFRNEVFASLEKVVDRLCDTICSLTADTIFSITGRDWIIKAFN